LLPSYYLPSYFLHVQENKLKRKVSNSNPFAHGLQVDREEKMMYTCATTKKKQTYISKRMDGWIIIQMDIYHITLLETIKEEVQVMVLWTPLY
jgi:hypothetical protein